MPPKSGRNMSTSRATKLGRTEHRTAERELGEAERSTEQQSTIRKMSTSASSKGGAAVMHSSMCASTLSHRYGESDSDDSRPDCEATEAADAEKAWWSSTGQAMSAEDRTGAEWWKEVAELMDQECVEAAAATGVDHTHVEQMGGVPIDVSTQGVSTSARCSDEWPF